MNKTVAPPEAGVSRRKFLEYGAATAGAAIAGFREIFFDPFEKKTGIKVFYEGTNSATNLTKMRAEKASPKRSLVFMDDVVLMTAMDEKLLTPLPTSIANLNDVVPRCIGVNRFWTNYMVMKSGVAI